MVDEGGRRSGPDARAYKVWVAITRHAVSRGRMDGCDCSVGSRDRPITRATFELLRRRGMAEDLPLPLVRLDN